MVQGLEEHACGSIESDDPPKGEDVVECDQDDGDLGDRNGRTLDGLEEGVSLAAAVPLLDTDNPEESRLPGWLLVPRNCTIVVGLIHERDDQDESNSPEDCENPVRPLPS